MKSLIFFFVVLFISQDLTLQILKPIKKNKHRTPINNEPEKQPDNFTYGNGWISFDKYPRSKKT